MSRVTSDEVASIIDISEDTARDLSVFINNASLIVTEDLAGSGLSEDRLKQIELFLAAHFVALKEERGALIGTKVGQSSEFYGGKMTAGLGLTRYGQHAISLDTTGILAKNSTPSKRAEFRVV